MRRPPLSTTLFPYTTLFRSYYEWAGGSLAHHPSCLRATGFCCAQLCAGARTVEDVLVEPHLRGDHWWRGPVLAVDWQLLTDRSEEHTSELQSLTNLVCRLLL